MNNTLELTTPPPTQTALVVTAPVNVDALDTAKPLAEIFAPYQTTLEKWEAKAKALVVTDISMKAEMQMARVARLELKEARVEMDKTRKGLVENLKARTSKIDGTARVIREKIESLEVLLLESEQFAERHAAKLKSELKASREAELIPFLETVLLGDLSDLSESDYAKTLSDAKLLRQTKIDAAAKDELDRKAKEEADRLEQERIVAEFARFIADAEATAKRLEEERKDREEQAAKERAERQAEREKAEMDRKAAEAKAKAERDAIEAAAAETVRKAREESDRLKTELAAKTKAEAEEKARVESERLAKEKEAKRAAAAPDNAKLKAFEMMLRSIEIPDFKDQDLADQVGLHLGNLVNWIESKTKDESDTMEMHQLHDKLAGKDKEHDI